MNVNRLNQASNVVIAKGNANAMCMVENVPTPEHKLEFINKILNNGDVLLNSIQLINFINYYFDEQQQPPPQQQHQSVGDYDEHVVSICFPCIACSYKFKFEQTFHLHLDRRSILIRVYCARCNTFKTFFNKCKLFYHMYSHKMQLFEPMYKSVQIELIPFEKLNNNSSNNNGTAGKQLLDLDLIFSNFDKLASGQLDATEAAGSPASAANSSYNSEFLKANFTNLVVNNRFKINDNDLAQIRMFIKKLLMNKFLVYKCAICDAIFFDLKELKQHYANTQKLEILGNQLNNQKFYIKMLKQKLLNAQQQIQLTTAKTDLGAKNTAQSSAHNSGAIIKAVLNNISYRKLQFSTRCYTLALLNMVKLNFRIFPRVQGPAATAPAPTTEDLICPECGLAFGPTKTTEFRLHLLYDCYFTFKYDLQEMRCLFRDCFYTSDVVQDMVNHWLKKHIVRVYKCVLCDHDGHWHMFNDATNNSNDDELGADSSSAADDTNDGSALNATNGNSILKYILNLNESTSQTPQTNSNTNASKKDELAMSTQKPVLSARLIGDINKHYFEKHRNQQVALKLIYKCLCKKNTCLSDLDESATDATPSGADNEPNLNTSASNDCVFDQWKLCKKHIISLLTKSANAINCLHCDKFIYNQNYQTHLRDFHTQTKVFICPICGIVRNEMSLGSHIAKHHSQMKLGQYGSSSFFNLVTSLNAKNDHILLSKTTANRKIQQQQQQLTNATVLSIQPVESNLTSIPLTIVNMNPSNYSMKTLINNLPDQYFMYLCLNCRLFFASNTTFSHNCWNLNDTSMKQTNNSKAPTTTSPTLANSNQPQPANVNPTTNSNSSNYFSPIYLKFNITKLLAGMNAKPAIVSNNDSTTNDEPITKKLKIANNNIHKNSNPSVAHNHVNTNNIDTSNPTSQPIDVESIQAK